MVSQKPKKYKMIPTVREAQVKTTAVSCFDKIYFQIGAKRNTEKSFIKKKRGRCVTY